MSLFDVGRLCVKIAGRDAGRTCVVVERVDDTFVLIDGGTRRKKVNVKHLEPLEKTIEVEAGASHETVAEKFKALNLPVWERKAQGEKVPQAGKEGTVSEAKKEKKG